jgi:methionyl-tRNA synthetase
MTLDPRYITTPIYYLNAPPHLGHAYTTIAADFLARFWRREGRPVFFLTGTDEHGQKIAQAAQSKGISPQEHVDNIAGLFQEMIKALGVTPDMFIRTTDPAHKEGAQALWTKLTEKGFIYEGTYAGWYAVRDEAFYKEEDIKDGHAPTGAPVEWVEETCFFFKLSAFQDKLLDFYERHPNFIAPCARYNEARSWVNQGLQDLAISRSTFTWGVPVPEHDAHVMYVWLDALSNYITALGYPDVGTSRFKTFWPHALHLLGKDILRFHAIYWPAFLMAADLPPPQRLFVHGWWLIEGEKMSKSLGNVISPQEMIEAYGLDACRYFLLRDITFGADGNFAEAALKQRFKADLANDLGNLVQRVLAFLQKSHQGIVPKPTAGLILSEELMNWRRGLHETLGAYVENQTIQDYIKHLWQGISLGNQFVDHLKPWALNKSSDPQDKKTLDTGLYILLDLIYVLGLYLEPLMPETASKIQACFEGKADHPLTIGVTLKPGNKTTLPQPLFPKESVA